MSSIPSPAASSDADERSDGASSPSGFIFRAGIAAHKAQAALASPPSPTEQHSQTSQRQHFVPQITLPQPAPRSMGPLSAEVKIPPRPKPGRKPMTTEGEGGEKRKAQNRNAQRRFRDKRQQKLEDQVEVNDHLRQEMQKATASFESRLNAVRLQNQSEVQLLQQQIERQQQEISRLQTALDKAEDRERSYPLRISSSRRHDSSAHSHSRPMETVSTPPDDNEIDFTNYGRSMGTEDKCGFCGTGDTCPCAQSAAAAAAASSAPIVVTPLSRQTGPGTCDQCQNDPTGERARACRELAANSTRGSIAPPTSRFLGRRTVPCGTVVDAFQSAHAEPSSISTLFGGQRMQAYAVEGGGFDYEHAEAAKVLVQLNERIVRKSSGRHDF